jgi:DNA-binding MarR family transcriptional regulator
MKLFKTKQLMARKEMRLGINDFSPTAKDAYAFIEEKTDTTITSIYKHDYFRNTSLSTIKRAVNLLLSHDLIEVNRCSQDRRKQLIRVKA